MDQSPRVRPPCWTSTTISVTIATISLATTPFFLLVSAAAAVQPQLASPRAEVASLKFVHVVWRHGDRTPSSTIPSDVNNPLTTWDPPKKGELTSKGAEQHFRLGKYIRQRYDGFLPATYSPSVVKVRRTDYNRTLWSARADLTGMFHPEAASFADYVSRDGSAKLSEYVMDCVPKAEDRLLSDAYEACPRVDQEEKAQYDTADFRAIERENEPLLRYLGEKSGLGKVPLPLKDMRFLFDPLTSEVAHPEKHHLPEWANATIRAEIWRLYDLKNHFEYNTELATRLQAGLLFSDILTRMREVATAGPIGSLSPQRFQIYSAHDVSVEGVLVIMGTHTRVYPRFATAVFIELHSNQDSSGGGDLVRFFHRNDTDASELWELPIAGCPAPCTVGALESATRRYIPTNLSDECKLATASGGGKSTPPKSAWYELVLLCWWLLWWL